MSFVKYGVQIYVSARTNCVLVLVTSPAHTEASNAERSERAIRLTYEGLLLCRVKLLMSLRRVAPLNSAIYVKSIT
jgi:hypothetical protein